MLPAPPESVQQLDSMVSIGLNRCITRGPSWSSDTSRRCSRSPRRDRSPPRPTHWRPCSRTCPTRCASSKPSSACRCSCAAGGGRAHRVRRARARAGAPGATRARSDARRPRAAAGARGRVRTPRRRRHREPLAGARARRRPPRARAGRAPARERGRVGAALRRTGRRRARAGGRHRAGQRPPTRGRVTCSRRTSSVSSGHDVELPREPVSLAAFARAPAGAPARSQPAAHRGRPRRRRTQGSRSTVPVEVEGIRLIADLVVAGDYASILPETAIPPEITNVRTVADRRSCHRAGSRW